MDYNASIFSVKFFHLAANRGSDYSEILDGFDMDYTKKKVH